MNKPPITANDLDAHAAFSMARERLEHRVIGQKHLTDRLLIALLADGHLLVEGAPGLAKTRSIKCLAELIDASYHRIQFTPDLLPADLTGTDIYQPNSGDFRFQSGPLFHSIVLADEINRAPAKVQSALLEAMAERQITVGRTTHRLPDLFMVMATQNPIEQEGTYPLPEAQMDRFLMHVRVDYPAVDTEREILRLTRREVSDELESRIDATVADVSPHLDAAIVQLARQQVMQVYLSEALEQYIVELVVATRDPSLYDPALGRLAEYGASPRGTIALERCARACAWLDGRDYVSPDDIQGMVFDVLRHRVIVSFDAEAEGVTVDDFVRSIVERVPVP